MFMSGSILDNLLLGLDSSNDDSIYKVIEACKKSEAHDFIINFPDGYQTQIGDRGTLLSGGQKQRLSIARALLKNTEFIILDEFTSAIDESTKDVISKNVIEIFKGKTILMITHDTRHFSLAKNIIEI
ncbi:ATP-binding cassette domain-containing protein [Vibrio campbellii]|uniref:ATP-binding cassette domain-containing protein n=1 Tax=Vibrio campbellii TaxID=680 RepID=UPI003D2F9F8B